MSTSKIAKANAISDGGVSNLPVVRIMSIQQFTTGTATMLGMLVKAEYSNGLSQFCTWTATGCGVNNFFTLSLADGANGSYDGTWTLTNSYNPAGGNDPGIKVLTLDGRPGNTVFDRTWNTGGTEGTPGSNIGFTVSGTAPGTTTGSGVYLNEIAVNNGAAVGDLYQILQITFSGTTGMARGSATFRADTDNVTYIPEPASIALVVTGFAALSLAIRRKAKRLGTPRK